MGVAASRPRSEQQILDAAYELLLTEGLKATTMEAIARRAGVSKVTIYKWWPTRAAVIMSAFLRAGTKYLPYPAQIEPDGLRERLAKMAREFCGPTGRIIAALVGEGQRDPEIAEAFRVGYVAARRAQGRDIVRLSIDAGLVRPADPDVVLDLIYGPLWYRLLVGHAPLTSEYVQAHVDLVWSGLQAVGGLPTLLEQ